MVFDGILCLAMTSWSCAVRTTFLARLSEDHIAASSSMRSSRWRRSRCCPGAHMHGRQPRFRGQVMRNNFVCDMEVSGLKTTYRDRNFDWYRTHRHHTTHIKQGSKPARPHTRTNARKSARRSVYRSFLAKGSFWFLPWPI
jgi:hypothetical protein